MTKKIAVLPGDGIGTEIVEQAVKVLKALGEDFEYEYADVGGVAYANHGHPLPPETLALAKEADAVLFGAVGDFKYDTLPRALRPEQAVSERTSTSSRTCVPRSATRNSCPRRRFARKWCRVLIL